MHIPKDIANRAERYIVDADFTVPQYKVLQAISDLDSHLQMILRVYNKDNSKTADAMRLILKENKLDTIEAIVEYLDQYELIYKDYCSRIEALKIKQDIEYNQLHKTFAQEYIDIKL